MDIKLELNRWYYIELKSKFQHFINFNKLSNGSAYFTDRKYLENLLTWETADSINISDITDYSLVDVSLIRHLLPKDYKFNNEIEYEIY